MLNWQCFVVANMGPLRSCKKLKKNTNKSNVYYTLVIMLNVSPGHDRTRYIIVVNSRVCLPVRHCPSGH